VAAVATILEEAAAVVVMFVEEATGNNLYKKLNSVTTC
jgi:hypothetical protein